MSFISTYDIHFIVFVGIPIRRGCCVSEYPPSCLRRLLSTLPCRSICQATTTENNRQLEVHGVSIFLNCVFVLLMSTKMDLRKYLLLRKMMQPKMEFMLKNFFDSCNFLLFLIFLNETYILPWMYNVYIVCENY